MQVAKSDIRKTHWKAIGTYRAQTSHVDFSFTVRGGAPNYGQMAGDQDRCSLLLPCFCGFGSLSVSVCDSLDQGLSDFGHSLTQLSGSQIAIAKKRHGCYYDLWQDRGGEWHDEVCRGGRHYADYMRPESLQHLAWRIELGRGIVISCDDDHRTPTLAIQFRQKVEIPRDRALRRVARVENVPGDNQGVYRKVLYPFPEEIEESLVLIVARMFPQHFPQVPICRVDDTETTG
jgi:hypothetical protein